MTAPGQEGTQPAHPEAAESSGKVKIPLLKSPAGGTLESVHAAVDSGADEVYLGVHIPTPDIPYATPFTCVLGLRGQGYCFSVEQVAEADAYCRKHGASLQVALNNNFSESLYPSALEAVRQLHAAGIKRYIVSDTAFMRHVHESYPDADMCASIMGGNTNTLTISRYESLGATRATLETCFNADEVAEIVRNSRIGIEVFVLGSP
jgi:putative protease